MLFLGNYISTDGITPDTSSLYKFTVKERKTKKKVRKIIGFLNYPRNFFSNFSESTLFITKMLSKENKIVFTVKNEKKLNEF